MASARAGVGPASAAARRRLGRARLLRFGANYKVAPAFASLGTAKQALEPAEQPGRRRTATVTGVRRSPTLPSPLPCRVAPGTRCFQPPAPSISVNPMARFLTLCTWLLTLAPGLLATGQTECIQDCATCSFRIVRPGDLNFLACTLECEGQLPSNKIWETCKDLLQMSKPKLSEDATDVLREGGKAEEGHLLAKKYGGFMKRYGGFMKKTDELYPGEPEEEANGSETLAKRYGGFMKKDAEEGDALANSSDLLKELLGTGDSRASEGHPAEGSDGEDVGKRYGGFMRGLKRSPQLEDEAKELQKRYGGFMRRVGRPEWWMDYQKRYGGFLKRFADSLPSEEDGESYSKEISEMEKRYGGFMRF